jgi:hypothetical protein
VAAVVLAVLLLERRDLKLLLNLGQRVEVLAAEVELGGYPEVAAETGEAAE